MGPYEFNPEDARRFANEQGARVQKHGDELLFDYCPYCHGGANRDKKTFSINLKTGQFKCLRESCGIAGNMITLSRDFEFDLGTDVDEYYRPKKVYRTFKSSAKPREPKDPAIKYMENRHIPKNIVAQYEITIKEGTDNVLVFPFYDEKSILRFIKYRKTDFDKTKDKNKEWCEANCKPILFGMKQCNDKSDRLIITEGQLDSLSVATAGIENAVSVPTGAKGFTWIPYCWNWVCKFDEIVVFGDFENGKMSLLDEIKQRFPNRIRFVLEKDYQGCKDANELLCKYGKEAVKTAVQNAQLVPVNMVIPTSEVKSPDIYVFQKIKTGLKSLDTLLNGGLPFGALTLLAGKRGEGKSTLASQIAISAIDQGYKVFSYSGEMTKEVVKSWMNFQAAGPNHITEKITDFKIDRFITDRNQELINTWYIEKSYMYDDSQVTDERENLLKTVEDTIRQYGINIVIIDNLMTALYIDNSIASDKYDRQSDFVRKLTKLARKYNCVIILVAHKRKNQNFNGDENDEVSGSMDITNFAGVIINYDRGSKADIEKGFMKEEQRRLTVTKNRMFGKTDYNGIILDFDEKSKRIYENHVDDVNREFGWNTEDGFMYVSDDNLDEIPF